MRDPLLLIVPVEVPRRLGERRVRQAANDDSILVFGHRLDEGMRFLGEGLARHPPGDGHHDVDDEGRLVVDPGAQ